MTSVNNTIQHALDWWHELPIDDIYEGKGWAQFCMKYHPNKTECYHFTGEEVQRMYEQEHVA